MSEVASREAAAIKALFQGQYPLKQAQSTASRVACEHQNATGIECAYLMNGIFGKFIRAG